MLQPREHSFQNLSPHGFHRVAYREWGHPASSRVRRLRARPDAQWPRFRCARLGAQRSLPDSLSGHARARRQRVAARPKRLRISDLPLRDRRVARPRARRARCLGRDVDGGLLGMVLAAQPETPVTRLVIDDVGPVIEPGGADSHRELRRTRPGFRQLRGARSARPRGLGAVRRLDRLSNGTRSRARRRARRRTPLAAQVRSRHCDPLSRRPRPALTCGASGTRFAARRCSCAGPSRIASVAPRPQPRCSRGAPSRS